MKEAYSYNHSVWNTCSSTDVKRRNFSHWSLFIEFNPFTVKCSQRQISTKSGNFILWHFEKQMAECDSTGRELSFEWSHQTILSTDSKVSLILPNSTKHSGSERVKGLTLYDGYVTIIGKVWCSRITCIFITFFFYQYINRYTSNRKEFFIQTTILQIKTYRAVTKISNCQV